MSVEQQPTPLIPKDHPLRQLFENERQVTLMRLSELNRTLGYSDATNAKERRRQARAPYNVGMEERQAS